MSAVQDPNLADHAGWAINLFLQALPAIAVIPSEVEESAFALLVQRFEQRALDVSGLGNSEQFGMIDRLSA